MILQCGQCPNLLIAIRCVHTVRTRPKEEGERCLVSSLPHDESHVIDLTLLPLSAPDEPSEAEVAALGMKDEGNALFKGNKA